MKENFDAMCRFIGENELLDRQERIGFQLTEDQIVRRDSNREEIARLSILVAELSNEDNMAKRREAKKAEAG